MSEPSTNGTHEHPGLDRFTVRGQVIEMDALDAYYEFSDLAEECRVAGQTHRDVLTEIIGRLRDRHGFELFYGEADWLFDEVALVHARKKKVRADAIAGLLTSPSSTASTPSP